MGKQKEKEKKLTLKSHPPLQQITSEAFREYWPTGSHNT